MKNRWENWRKRREENSMLLSVLNIKDTIRIILLLLLYWDVGNDFLPFLTFYDKIVCEIFHEFSFNEEHFKISTEKFSAKSSFPCLNRILPPTKVMNNLMTFPLTLMASNVLLIENWKYWYFLLFACKRL